MLTRPVSVESAASLSDREADMGYSVPVWEEHDDGVASEVCT